MGNRLAWPVLCCLVDGVGYPTHWINGWDRWEIPIPVLEEGEEDGYSPLSLCLDHCLHATGRSRLRGGNCGGWKDTLGPGRCFGVVLPPRAGCRGGSLFVWEVDSIGATAAVVPSVTGRAPIFGGRLRSSGGLACDLFTDEDLLLL